MFCVCVCVFVSGWWRRNTLNTHQLVDRIKFLAMWEIWRHSHTHRHTQVRLPCMQHGCTVLRYAEDPLGLDGLFFLCVGVCVWV